MQNAFLLPRDKAAAGTGAIPTESEMGKRGRWFKWVQPAGVLARRQTKKVRKRPSPKKNHLHRPEPVPGRAGGRCHRLGLVGGTGRLGARAWSLCGVGCWVVGRARTARDGASTRRSRTGTALRVGDRADFGHGRRLLIRSGIRDQHSRRRGGNRGRVLGRRLFHSRSRAKQQAPRRRVPDRVSSGHGQNQSGSRQRSKRRLPSLLRTV